MAKDYIRNPKKDKRGLTPQEAVFADNVLEVGKEAAAAMAYPDATRESQGVMASRNLSKPDIVLSISKELDRQGVKDETLCQAIKRGLDEESPKAYLKAAEIGFKLKGHLKTEKEGGVVPITKDLFVELCSVFWGTKPA